MKIKVSNDYATLLAYVRCLKPIGVLSKPHKFSWVFDGYAGSIVSLIDDVIGMTYMEDDDVCELASVLWLNARTGKLPRGWRKVYRFVAR